MVETLLREAEGPRIVRRAYALVVERSSRVLPSPSAEPVVVAGSRQDVKATIGPERTIGGDLSRESSRLSQMQAVGSESVGCLAPIV